MPDKFKHPKSPLGVRLTRTANTPVVGLTKSRNTPVVRLTKSGNTLTGVRLTKSGH